MENITVLLTLNGQDKRFVRRSQETSCSARVFSRVLNNYGVDCYSNRGVDGSVGGKITVVAAP